MIKANGGRRWAFDWGAVIQVIVIIATVIAIHFHTVGEIKAVLAAHDVKIQYAEKRIAENTAAIGRLEGQ